MARLNDFAAPSESVEALKRRFVRQNREIARVNSMQSLRIRSLESEISHLLGENVSLREQVINLTQEIDRLESAKLLYDGVYDIKSRLDAKVAELNGIASELGMLPRKIGKVGDKAGDSDHSKATALDTRPRATDSEFNTGVDDGKLPAILEDKYFPRRTLEPQEIHNLVQADHSLPNSPHAIHLDHDHSDITADISSPLFSKPLPRRQPETETDALALVSSLPPTLETRKKKKKTVSSGPISEGMAPPESPSPKIGDTQPGKSGSKRKFRPDDDGFLSDTAPEDDEFQFRRPSHSPLKQTDPFDFMRPDFSPSKTPVNMKRGSSSSGASKRKVLEPKSANANLGSPQKARASLQPENKMAAKMGRDENIKSPVKPKELESSKNKSLSQKPRVRSTPMLQKQKRSSRSTEYDEAYSQPVPIMLKDSPVARSGEGLMGVSDLAASRPSRRRGAVVSYAEPNLRDKMRRPTSEMADAVIAGGSRRSSSLQFRESLDNADDHSRKSGAGSGSLLNGSLPADLALADQATDVFMKDIAPEQLIDTVSHRRQSRRHSSNPKSTARHVSSHDVDFGESPTTFTQMEGAEGEETPGWNSAMDVGHRRETRIAARRKSMMV
ncbi:hypothetical protein N7448_005864 [Penicillium atrosanguineum]|uniref:Shugoshin n=1 Tax=Penicillium atrosanguineum TaxID=1132637 RepID=A0A9W9U1I0_9EURO|nr:hypothetical protein N7448_005864 [Penicillium atrosanguineum]KAJ5138089.1 hypothetical protein N7526_004322 [Penicillium atrosanguineum]KAJ5307189.1 hypothetical protein N7476_007845 [Penicillium atrosanguineum]